MNSLHNGRGGKREGAGRPTLGPSPLKQVTVRLPQDVIDTLKAQGGGNLSEGIRRMIDPSKKPTSLR